MNQQPISVAQSGAFVEAFELPPSGSGPLDGLRFAVKDLIDIAGHKTACGNPTWRDTHPPAVDNAVCVEQILAAGARFIGKTVTDELAFSLIGENHFYGTPLNPRAPDRVPGGSSSGSASSVACGLSDFALGTDTGGSIRIPAGNCGIWGLRPSHGIISVAGANPLAPTFDTVGVLARSAEMLALASSVLLNCGLPVQLPSSKVHVLTDSFELSDDDVRQALAQPLQQISSVFPNGVRQVRLADIFGAGRNAEWGTWLDTYCVLQWAEIDNCLGAWIAEVKPEFGAAIGASFELVKTLDRARVPAALARREELFRLLNAFLGPTDLLCVPTAPILAPEKGSELRRDSKGGGYFARTLSLTALAGIGRLPQVSMPLGNADGVPVGLSLIAGHGNDGFLLAAARAVAAAFKA